jgi:hypothetical protein
MSRVVRLYGQPDCHLCDEAEAHLRALAGRLRFTVEKVDVTAPGADGAAYLLAIPVIAVGGVEILRAPIRPAALEDALREAFGA